jgi:phosphocarrier protein FPr/phosphocarrier protein
MTKTEQSDGATIEAADTGERGITLAAPLAGWLTAISDVPDPVFSQEILGPGVAIDPFGNVLTAPADAVVGSAHRAHHAVSLRLANGVEILLHIGLETVSLGGEGFTLHVAEGQRVKTGDPLITFDMDFLAHKAKSLVIPIVVLTEGYRLTALETNREIGAGEPMLVLCPVDGATPAVAAATTTTASGPQAVSTRLMLIRDPDGLHARPAGLIADCAKRFDAKVLFRANGKEADARSPVKMMLLGLGGGSSVEVSAIGRQAEEVLDALQQVIDSAAGAAPAGLAPVAPETSPAPCPPAGAALPPFAADERADIKAVQAVSGLATGRALPIARDRLEVPELGDGAGSENQRLEHALDVARTALAAEIEASRGRNQSQAEILKAHLSFLDDPDLIDGARDLIGQGKSAAFAWRASASAQAAALKQLGNARLAERAADLQDVEHRILMILLGKTATGLAALPAGSVILATDLLPSQLSGMDSKNIAGMCFAEGGPTSHVAILAASLGIPTLVAGGPDVLRVTAGTPVILDADHMVLRVNPPQEDMAAMETRIARRRDHLNETRSLAGQDCRMADGRRIEVVANLASPSDALTAVANGAEGCGLLRSEFLFLERKTAPSEEEQLAQYQSVADSLEGRPLIIRTLDAGADKVLPYLNLPEEINPALGIRGIRASLWRPETLRTQLRAILRVRPLGQCRIMVPMVAVLDELRTVKTMLQEECNALGITEKVPLGIMVEVPSVAVMADVFAEESDFFSIGTNDLTQYTLAMDRMNPRLAQNIDAFDPAVLRLIAQTTAGAAKFDRWTSVCGGLASIPLAAPVLIGLGVTELSASASAIPEIKALVRTLTFERCQEVAREALAQPSAAAVRRLLSSYWPEV